MKKIFVTVTLILTLALCSCGRSPQTTPAANENTGAESSAPAAAKEEADEKDRAADESSDESSDESLSKASDLSVGAPLQADGMAITDSGYCIKNGYLYGFVTIENSSESTAYDFPKYRVTAFNKDGNVLGTEEQTLSRLDPLCSFTFGSLLFDIAEEPDRVEFELLPPEDYAMEAASPEDALLLEVDGALLNNGKVTGMILNSGDEAIGTAVLCVICFDADGNVIDINDTFVDDVPAGGSAPFEISVTKEEVDEFRVFAGKWM